MSVFRILMELFLLYYKEKFYKKKGKLVHFLDEIRNKYREGVLVPQKILVP